MGTVSKESEIGAFSGELLLTTMGRLIDLQLVKAEGVIERGRGT